MRTMRGFSLIELLVVVAIIALLISVTMPAFAEVRRVSKKSVCQHNLHQIGVGIHSYLQANRDTFPHLTRIPSYVPPPPQPTLPTMMVGFKRELGENSRVFNCPDDENTKMPDLGSIRYFNAFGTSYEWENELNGLKLRLKTLHVLRDLLSAQLKDVWMVFDFEAYHGGPQRLGSHNVLYADLRVQSDKWIAGKVVGEKMGPPAPPPSPGP